MAVPASTTPQHDIAPIQSTRKSTYPIGNGTKHPNVSLDKLLSSIIQTECAGRGAHVADTRVKQAVHTSLYEQGIKDGHVFLTGSKYEGMH